MSEEEWFWRSSFSKETKKSILDFIRNVFENSEIFVLREYSPSFAYTEITLIHEPLLRKTIQKEPYLQRFIMENFGTIDSFFLKLRNPSCNISKYFHYDDHALGLAFGYGEENSAYASRQMGIQHLTKKNFYRCGNFIKSAPSFIVITHRLRSQWSIASLDLINNCQKREDQTIEEELESLKSLTYVMPTFTPPYLFFTPTFIAKKCTKTDEIMQKYGQAMDRLANMHNKKPMTQILLELTVGNTHKNNVVSANAL